MGCNWSRGDQPTLNNDGGSRTSQDAKPYKEFALHVTKAWLTYENGGNTKVFHVEARSKRIEYGLECRERQYNEFQHTCAHLVAGQDYKVDLYPDAQTVAFSDNRPLLNREIEMPYAITSQDER